MAFPRKKTQKLWIWKAYARDQRRCVAWVVGGRDASTFKKLWRKIEHPHRLYHTDWWQGFRKVIPPPQHKIGKEHTLAIERDNNNTRHRVGRFTRRTKVVSRSREMVDLTLRLWNFFEDPLHFNACRSLSSYLC